MHKSGRISALKKVINQRERWTYTLNINYRAISAIIKVCSRQGGCAEIKKDNGCKSISKRKTCYVCPLSSYLGNSIAFLLRFNQEHSHPTSRIMLIL